MSDYVLTLSDSQLFDKVLAENDQVVVRFTAPWCIPCRQFGPHFDAVAEQAFFSSDMLGRTQFVVVDVDVADWAVLRYGIQSVPTTLVFRFGERLAEVARTTATRTALTFAKELQDL